MKTKIMVSVLCLTYNHEKYIRQSLDSFLSQKTDFQFEILINDDASTDGTVDILKEYQAKYPDIIKPIFHKTNQYSTGKRSFFLRYLIPLAKGRYLATCEGDDFWTDTHKLQTQVDFLEKNIEHTVCFHKVRVVYENGQKSYEYPDVEESSWYTTNELIKVNYIHTSSVMYRRLTYENTVLDVSPADWYLHLYHASKGKIKFIKKTMSTYRKHDAGIWWDYDTDNEKIWRKYGKDHIRMLNALLVIYPDSKYQQTINNCITRIMGILVRIDFKYDDNILAKVVAEFPHLGAEYISHLKDKDKKNEKEIRKLWQAIHDQDEILAYKQALIEQKEAEITLHKNNHKLTRIKTLAKKAVKR